MASLSSFGEYLTFALMLLPIDIKASTITNLTDARYFAAWDVTWMGFNLDPSSDSFVDPHTVHAIKDWVEGPQIVGECHLQEPDQIQSLIDNLDLDALQIGPLAPVETLIELNTDKPVIKELIVDPQTTAEQLESAIEAHAPHCAYFLLNLEANGLGLDTMPLDRSFLEQLCQDHQILLSLARPLPDLDYLLDTLKPSGLSVRGGEEEKVGFKSFDELDDLFEALEEQRG